MSHNTIDAQRVNARVIRVISVLVACIVSLVVISGCGASYSGSARVVDKKYTASFTTVSFMQVGKSLFPMTRYHPEKWEVRLSYREYGTDRLAWREVSRSLYDNVENGSAMCVYNEHKLEVGTC